MARGLVSEAELAAIGETQVQHFIFTPGFTTAASVTTVSGRGVGMEVVKANIERIGGTIGVHSVLGQGTLLTLRIPLTLAIIAAFILEARGERFRGCRRRMWWSWCGSPRRTRWRRARGSCRRR